MLFSRRLYTLLLAVAGSSMLLNCQTWDLPTRKTQRQCGTPGGQFGSSANQLVASFTISQPTGTTDRVDWDFGDAKTQSTTELSIAHTYAAKGTYTVKATMTNLCGGPGTVLTTTVKVSDAVPPTVIILDPTAITKNTATLRMMVTDNGKAPVTEYGICYSKTSTNPMLTDPNTMTAAGTGIGTVNQTLSIPVSGLEPYVTYYVRAYARNEANLNGTPSYSTEVRSFQLLADPIVNIVGGPSISGSTGTVSFSVVNQGNPAAVQYGIVYSANTNSPTIETASTVTVASPSFTSGTQVALTGLSIDRTYYYRAFARSANGTVYSTTTGTFSTVDITSDLIINVPFTNQTYTDLSGSNNNANPTGNPTFTTDHKGAAASAILLNGNGQYFYFIDGAALRPAALSISFWIKANALTDRMQLYNKSRFSDNLGEQYSSLIKPADSGSGITINTDIKQGSNCNYSVGWQTFPVTSNLPIINIWRHIVFTYEGRTARMYLDGTLLSERTDLPASNMDNCAGGDLKFGAQIKDYPQYFNGAMDDIRVYKRALTSAQAKALSDL